METAEGRYEQLKDRLLALYREDRQVEALELLAAVDGELAPWSAELAHFEACMHGSLGDADAALNALLKASADGAWWHESLLLDDSDLAGLRGRPEFEQLVELSRRRKTNDRSTWTIDLPSGPAAGVVVAFHGAGQRAARAARDWAPVLELGYALVSVDSSQLISPEFRTWLEPELVVADIRAALAGFPAVLRGLPVIAVGFSDGGRAALDWALSAVPVPVQGVIVLAPAFGELPAAAANPLAPATILIGTSDHLISRVDASTEDLAALGLEVVRIPELGHQPPADFADRLAKLLPRVS